MSNICITDIILSSMERGKLTALVLLDLSKAFDSINHLILLEKLQIHGVSAEATQWLKVTRQESVRSYWFCFVYGTPKNSWCTTGYDFGTLIIQHLYK